MQAQAIANVLGGAVGEVATNPGALRHEIGRGFEVEDLERVAARVHADAARRRALMCLVVPEARSSAGCAAGSTGRE